MLLTRPQFMSLTRKPGGPPTRRALETAARILAPYTVFGIEKGSGCYMIHSVVVCNRPRSR